MLLLDEPFGALDAITRRQVRDELGDILTQLELPTLLVTHAFEDATALAQRIGVIDSGRLVQLATPSELLAAPASVMVAALTGANILQGTATPTPSGSTVHLQGGGELESATPARGPVHVAVHPWQLGLADADACSLTDTVVSVHHERGGLTIRLTRFTIQTPIQRQRSCPGQRKARSWACGPPHATCTSCTALDDSRRPRRRLLEGCTGERRDRDRTETETAEQARWLTPGVSGIGIASLLSDLGHEVPTSLLPSLLTSTLRAPASALGVIEGVADGLAGFARLGGGALADDPARRRSVAVGGYATTAILSGLIGAAGTVWQVAVLRAGAWTARGLRVPARNALLADVVPAAVYGRAYGFERAMDNLGAIGGPLLALATRRD